MQGFVSKHNNDNKGHCLLTVCYKESTALVPSQVIRQQSYKIHRKINRNQERHKGKGKAYIRSHSLLRIEQRFYFSVLLLFSLQVVSNCSPPHGLQHARLPCPSPSPGVCPSSCPLSQWRLSTISSSVTLFSPAFNFCSIRVFSLMFTAVHRKVSCSHSVYLNLKKMIQMNLFVKQNQTHRLREWTYSYQWGRTWQRRRIDWEFGIDMYTLPYLK